MITSDAEKVFDKIWHSFKTKTQQIGYKRNIFPQNKAIYAIPQLTSYSNSEKYCNSDSENPSK